MESNLTFKNFYGHPRFWRHVGLWIIAFLFLFVFVLEGMIGNATPENMAQFCLFLGSLMFLVYGSFYAFNKLSPQGKFGQFALVCIVIVVIVSTVDAAFSLRVMSMGSIEGFWAAMLGYPIFIFVAFGFKLTYHGAKQLFVIERLKRQQVESELKLLKSQINPHFLFNTLNNIYSTNLEDHEKANDIILELSDLLRYQLESNKKKVTSLKEEVSSLENYISLEKIRVQKCKVRLTKNGNFESVQIIPLLLLPFVENAFKYGTGIEAGDIEMKMDLSSDNLFQFYCKNKIVQKKGRFHSGGIGLQNVKKRLELMYTGKYDLDIDRSTAYFIVDLKVQL